MSNLMEASREWATRKDDERFLSLEDLAASVKSRKEECWTANPLTKDLRIEVMENDDISVNVYDPAQGERRNVIPTNWGFGQLCQYAKAPASYMRQLPATLAGINLQHGFENDSLRDDVLILGQTNGNNILRSMTSTSYGRIWDIEVVNAVQRANEDDRWKVPSASYSSSRPKRATTLYASDRDVFIFLVDPQNPIEVKGETLFRGFFAWNSEVGSATFGLTTFLYRFICDNRIVWGATEVKELKIRHTGGAPDRFRYEGMRYLQRYAEESTQKTVEQIKKADAFEIPNAAKKDGVEEWLKARGFTSATAKNATAAARAEEGEARSLWDIVNGITAHARTIPHTDTRIQLEKQAGNLLNLVA